jgi:hypothetical protein
MRGWSLSTQYRDLVSCICCVVEGFCVQLLAHYCGRLKKMFYIMYTSNLLSFPCTPTLIALGQSWTWWIISTPSLHFLMCCFHAPCNIWNFMKRHKSCSCLNCCLKCVFFCFNFCLIWQSWIQAIKSLRSISKGFWYQCEGGEGNIGSTLNLCSYHIYPNIRWPCFTIIHFLENTCADHV